MSSDDAELTAELLAQIREFDDFWRTRITSTARADRPAVEAALARFYVQRGLSAPRWFVWMDSPAAAACAAHLLAGAALRNGEDAAAVNEQQKAGIRVEVERQVPFEEVAQACRAGLKQIRPSELKLSFFKFVMDAAGADVEELGWTMMRQGARSAHLSAWLDALTWVGRGRVSLGSLPMPGWLAHDVGWGPRGEFTLTCPGPRLSCFLLHTRGHGEALDLYRDICTIYEHTSYVQMMPDVVVLAQNPTGLHLDRVGRLHNERGPALTYADGLSSGYAWRGTPVPAAAITAPVDLEAVVREPNVEVRRCLIELMGWDEFVRKAQLQPVGAAVADPGNAPHTLQLYDLGNLVGQRRGRSRERLLLCTNGSAERDGTRRRYGLFVPARHNDPIEAAADLYGVSVATYKRMQVRT